VTRRHWLVRWPSVANHRSPLADSPCHPVHSRFPAGLASEVPLS
jgi:hypothetical protein